MASVAVIHKNSIILNLQLVGWVYNPCQQFPYDFIIVDEPSSTVRARRPPIPSEHNEYHVWDTVNTLLDTSSNITDEYDDAEISCWPAVKGVGTVIIVSLLIWSFLMFVYTAPSGII